MYLQPLKAPLTANRQRKPLVTLWEPQQSVEAAAVAPWEPLLAPWEPKYHRHHAALECPHSSQPQSVEWSVTQSWNSHTMTCMRMHRMMMLTRVVLMTLMMVVKMMQQGQWKMLVSLLMMTKLAHLLVELQTVEPLDQ